MAESKCRHEWRIASAQMAEIINMFSAKGRKVKPDELNPYVRKRRVTVPLEFLKEFSSATHKFAV
jgi:hypothetical protein